MNNLIKNAVTFFRVKTSWLGDGGTPVPLEQAQQRADVCLGCPNNQEKPIYELFAGAVAHDVIRQLKAKDAMNLRVRREECLHVCSICNCILRLKVHVPLKYILESGIPDGLPLFCWQITERNNQQTTDHDNKIDGLPEQ